MAKEEKDKKTTKTTKTTKKETKKTPVTETKKKETTAKNEKNTKKVTKTAVVQEENNYGKTILAAILIVVLFLSGYLAVQYKKNGGFTNEEKYVATKDEKKFKEEYENLNGTTRSDGQKNKEVNIIKDNNITYITLEEAVDILDSGTGVIYFGFASCPYCRNSVPILLDAMNSSKLDKIYYVNIRPEDKKENDLRDTYTLDAKNKARKTKDAEKAYYNVLLALANYLDDYVLKTEKGKEVNTGEKRLYAPTVVAVKEGVTVGFHQGTVKEHNADELGNLPDLTTEQRKELLNTYNKLISSYLSDTCTDDTEGC